MAEEDDTLKAGKDAFERASDAEGHNRTTALDDIKFSRGGEQWPSNIVTQRTAEGRPCLTINKLPAFIRQVVNDARQNKPAIKVHPADSQADVATADIINGLIRNIEYTSNADVAYDTGTECAVTGGFGYWRITLDHAYDDSVELDLGIKRVANPFSIYGDPDSREADSSDWDSAFVVDRLNERQFKAQYSDKAKVDWNDDAWSGLRGTDWRDEESCMIAEWWSREVVQKQVFVLPDGSVFTQDDAEAVQRIQILIASGVIRQEDIKPHKTKSHKVTQRIMSGAEILETRDWPGRFIPIVPVYGDEFDIEGKRYFRSLVHNAIDAQRMFNYWRTASTELVALAPKVPYIGPKGAFDSDMARWNTANTRSHPFLEYDVTGGGPPQRQPLDMGVAAGALQEALNASDDIKSIIGLYDASLGARSNETSGKAIMARQREGDVSTFHFIDNMARAIRHTGRILIDLIPKVYTTPRIIRVIGEDGSQVAKQVNQEAPQTDKKGNPVTDDRGAPIMALHDLTAGKYDLTVTTGPSFTTRRQEAAESMSAAVQAFPMSAPVILPHLAKNLDWPGADEIAQELEAQKQGQLPPEVQQQIEQGQQELQRLTEENQQLKADQQTAMAKIESEKELALIKLQAEEQIEMAKIQSQERIAQIKIAGEMKINSIKAANDAQNAADANRMKAQQRPAK